MLCEASPEVRRRNRREIRRRFVPVYLLFFVSWLLFTTNHPARNSPLAFVLAVFYVGSLIAMLATFVVMMTRQRDEYQRQLITQSMLWGIGGTLSITTVWGALEFLTNVPHLPIVATFPIFLVIAATAKLTLVRRNRPAAE